MIPRDRAKSLPTEDSFRQKGHRASWLLKVLKRKVSSQCPHMMRHIPGVGLLVKGAGLERGLGSDWPGFDPDSVKLMIRLQLPRGHAILKRRWLAHQETIARASYVLFTRRSFPLWAVNWTQNHWVSIRSCPQGIKTYRGFVTALTLDHMLFTFAGDVNHGTTDIAGNLVDSGRSRTGHHICVRWRRLVSSCCWYIPVVGGTCSRMDNSKLETFQTQKWPDGTHQSNGADSLSFKLLMVSINTRSVTQRRQLIS